MKKYLSIMLIVCLLFVIISCGDTALKDASFSVTFYKDGNSLVSNDKQVNEQIFQDVIGAFKNGESREILNLFATTDLIREIKRTEMAIEIQIDEPIEIDNPIVSSKIKTLFIPLTGEYDYFIFRNTFKYPNDWSGPVAGGEGLEKYFENITIAPLNDEERRWQSTVETPDKINFYEKGMLLGKSEYLDGFDLNYEIATHIETWFYKNDDIKTINVELLDTQKPWDDVNYIELSFNHNTKFYGEEIIKEKYHRLTIPLEGEYAYHIFTSDLEKYSNVVYVTGGSELEQYFEEFKNK